MELWLWIILDDITASSAEVFSSEGHSVTLSCKYSVKADNLQWYQQDPGSAPQFLLLITDTSDPTVVTAKPPHPRLTVKLNKERNLVDLQISSAALTDSAVYYCALKPTVTGNTTTLDSHTDKLLWYVMIQTRGLIYKRVSSADRGKNPEVHRRVSVRLDAVIFIKTKNHT
uniref:Ig-like domain-containing protein n=1 Tax=Labrus bergylta TaxID=56723 RepID=A0A3Q3FAS1_9LABR